MIVCNEESTIGACLESVQSLADEIIVVDTGSQDRTLEIARRYGARTYSCRWNNHFAEARNFALKRATGDWILVMDADERLEPPEPLDAFSVLTADPSAAGYYVTIRQLRSQQQGDYETDHVCRLYRNVPGLAYHGRIHEDIGMSLAACCPGLSIKRSPLILTHYGYLQETAQRKDKAARNMKLLKRAVAEESDQLYYRYALGAELFLQECYEEAAAQLSPLLPLVPPGAGYVSDLAYKLAFSNWQLGAFTAALGATETGLVRDPFHPELLELRGILLLKSNRPEEAHHSLTRLARSPSSSGTDDQPRHRYWLGTVQQQLGNWREALGSFRESALHEAYRTQAMPRWLSLAVTLYPALQVFETLTAPPFSHSPQKALELLSPYVMRKGCGSELLPLFDQANAAASKAEGAANRELAFFNAVLLAQSGQQDCAADLLQALLSHRPEKHLVLYLWALENLRAENLVTLNLLYSYEAHVPELAVLAHALLGHEPAGPLPPTLPGQAAYAMLMMEAWSCFLLVWSRFFRQQSAGRTAVPWDWRLAIYRAPASVREAVRNSLSPFPEEGAPLHDSLFAAQLAWSLGHKEEAAAAFREMMDQFPQRLEPRIGLYGVLRESDSLAEHLFLSDS
jgi:predicted Zn-dependent protease